MGSVDIIPGISGGTIAFITGIYQELIKSIDNFSLKKLLTGDFKTLWSNINGPFIISLFLGIISGIFFLSGILIYLFEYHPISISALIFGIIFGTFFQFIGMIKNKKIDDYIWLFLSIMVSIGLTQLNSLNAEPSLIYLFFCSALAISAMLLPGISGAMIFLILGVYNEVLLVIQNSIRVLADFNKEEFYLVYSKIFAIAIGILLGLKIFSKIIVWLFNYKKRKTMIVLTGLVGGSLTKIWPLKNCLNFEILKSPLVSNKSFIICKTNEITEGVFFILVGIVIIFVFNRLKKPIEYF